MDRGHQDALRWLGLDWDEARISERRWTGMRRGRWLPRPDGRTGSAPAEVKGAVTRDESRTHRVTGTAGT
jgi:hypothetical protein